MSIISDAIKKAQTDKNKVEDKSKDQPIHVAPRTNVTPEPANDAPTYEQKEKPTAKQPLKRNNLSQLLIVFFSILGISFVLLYFLSPPSFMSRSSGVTLIKRVKPSDKIYNVVQKPSTKDIIPLTEKTTKINNFAQVKKEDIPVLNGIMYSPPYPAALLNGATVHEGETVYNATVVKIYPDRVRLKIGNEELELKLQ